MKKMTLFIFFIVSFFVTDTRIQADQQIVESLKEYPEESPEQAAKKLAQKLNQPGKLANTRVKHNHPLSLSGLFATYAGFLTVSDVNGEIEFPRKHTQPFIYLLVTEALDPIVMTGNTLSHWQLDADAQSMMYKIIYTLDKETHLSYWDVTQVPLPQNGVVPLETMVLFANPKYIYVPLGITLAKESPHLLLPDIYIKKGIHLSLETLYVLNMSHYYGPILSEYKKEKNGFATHLTY